MARSSCWRSWGPQVRGRGQIWSTCAQPSFNLILILCWQLVPSFGHLVILLPRKVKVFFVCVCVRLSVKNVFQTPLRIIWEVNFHPEVFLLRPRTWLVCVDLGGDRGNEGLSPPWHEKALQGRFLGPAFFLLVWATSELCSSVEISCAFLPHGLLESPGNARSNGFSLASLEGPGPTFKLVFGSWRVNSLPAPSLSGLWTREERMRVYFTSSESRV